jgi:two-component system alkaline phosphatase synthesis response regulator PhoP
MAMTSTKRILIADDDEGLVDALARRCQALGLEVAQAYDGTSALATIDALEPDLVILDVNMPSGSGLRVCEMVSQDPELQSIPVIVLTGRTDGETIAACNRLDACYVRKGPDIWSQLEPLVADRLAIRRDAGQTHQASQATTAENRADESEPQTEADRIRERYINTIFAALGGNRARLQECPNDHAQSAVTRPWVLCVDDDFDFAAMLKLRLEQHGIDVLHAFAGMEGYRVAFTHEAQAIILDQEMPDGNGEYLLRRLKESPATEGIPVIVLTGQKDQALARRMYNLGAARFLTKPVDWDDLWEELRPLIYREAQPAPLCSLDA